MRYLDLLRSQVKMLLDNSIDGEDGRLMVPCRATPEGWDYSCEGDGTATTNLRIYELAHLYHASMSQEDYDIILRVRDGDKTRDWNKSEVGAARAEWYSEYSRFQYYDGKNPNWPEKALQDQYQRALENYHKMEADDRTVAEIIEDNLEPVNAVFTKVLTQVMLGSPQYLYHSGMLRATVRYFDRDRVRPGLPPDVAALVDELSAESVGVQLVNTNRNETRNLIVQAGAFGEHQFTQVRYGDGDDEQVVPLDGKYFAVELPPSTAIRLGAGLRRFANQPSYAFPWHGDTIPVPFE
jgi:hypothetical protein